MAKRESNYSTVRVYAADLDELHEIREAIHPDCSISTVFGSLMDWLEDSGQVEAFIAWSRDNATRRPKPIRLQTAKAPTTDNQN